jgi:hypothetical protein
MNYERVERGILTQIAMPRERGGARDENWEEPRMDADGHR